MAWMGVRTGAGVAALTLALGGLSGCANETGVADGASDVAVEMGASKAEYQRAFEDVAPIELRTQTPAPKGSTTGLPMERYYEAVTEWSNGKITFDIAYSNSIAAPEEVDDALVDGRLDLGAPLPVYEPAEYPAINALIELGALNDTRVVVGDLQSNAWPNQVALASEEIAAEFDEHGMVGLLPIFNSGADAMFCTEPRAARDDFKGAVVSSGGAATSDQVAALGASSTSIPYTELFEALQRNAVDCTVAGTTVGVLGGFISAAPHIVIDPAAGFVIAPGSLAASKETWESLPLVARQLLWDRLDTFVRSNLEEKIWVNVIDAVKQARDADGAVSDFDESASAAIRQMNDVLIEEVAQSKVFGDAPAFVDEARQAAQAWEEIVTDELGTDWDYNKLAAGESKAPAIDWYVERLFDEVFGPYRPQ